MMSSPPVVSDEMMDVEDRPRPAWEPLWHMLNQASHRDLDRLDARVQSQLLEQAISYTIHGDADEERPWQLDPLPFVIDEQEWHGLVPALVQRATALDAFLEDCYGPRRCIADGVVSARYLHEHPGHLAACRGLQPPGGHLQCYAVDLVRGTDGIWRVLADRCQSPLGLGYALQNRLVIAAALPDLFTRMRVQPLAGFFRRLEHHLRSLAGCDPADAHLVVLGSAVYGDNAFEQALLARSLGVELVAGQDLTVRRGRCHVKTITGLRPVDVILRFIDDRWCDPLYFKGDSLLGVPGLLDAVAGGRVAVVNGLGSGLAESPALRPLVGDLIRYHLSQEPLIEALPSHWGGDPDGLARLQRHGGDLVWKRSWNAQRSLPFFPEQEDPAVLAELQEQLLSDPSAWCGEARLRTSQAPVWHQGVLSYRPVSLRVFLLREADGWLSLPGGLLRSAAAADQLHIGPRHGGGSKDCWVRGADLTTEPRLAALRPARLTRHGFDLPSRVVDDLFTAARQGEDFEHVLRVQLLLIRQEHRQGLPEDAAAGGLQALAQRLGLADEEAPVPPASAAAQVLAPMAQRWSQTCLRVRNYLSAETWTQVQTIAGRSARIAAGQGDAQQQLERCLVSCNAIAGTLADNTIRDHAWRFLDLGKRLQRAVATSRLLVDLLEPGDPADLRAALSLCDSLLIYRARYRSAIERAPVFDLLVLDGGNPRSLRFQIDRLHEVLTALPRRRDAATRQAHRHLEHIRAGLVHLRLSELDATAWRGLVQDLVVDLLALAEAIDHAWFSHVEPPQAVQRRRGPAGDAP